MLISILKPSLYDSFEWIFSLLSTGTKENPEKLDRDALADVVFKEMDYNNDNIVTKDEFIKACIGNDKISEHLAFKMFDICNADVE